MPGAPAKPGRRRKQEIVGPRGNNLFARRPWEQTRPYSFDLRKAASYRADTRNIIAHCRSLQGDPIHPVSRQELVPNPAETGTRNSRVRGLEQVRAVIADTYRADEIRHSRHHETDLEPHCQAPGDLAR